ncbi:hypothetical protein CYMTET_31154 [Cymbomonas tetramitiformis]|uniref:Uncharacterized protein n=1 Tax=Cymbomonas tetramitiformis TaxID=36881 RepID=A0AAE0KTF5_9CHLO|nr:hypothetical protein CYMTET_31154 [Cymbomonas tetramitiformis]
MCKEAFNTDRAPATAVPASARPPPPSSATVAHLALPAAELVPMEQAPAGDVVVPEPPAPEPTASFSTGLANIEPPTEDGHGDLHAEGAAATDHITPAAFASAVHADEDFDFPALREPKWWQPPLIHWLC